MAKATFLNTTTLKVVEAVDERTPMEFVQSAEQYYKMSGIDTIVSPEEGYYLIKDRKATKNVLLVAYNGCAEHTYEDNKKLVKQLPYYAVAHGLIPDIYRTWSQAKKSIDGVKNARYKKFYSLEVAKQWMEENGAPLRAYDKY